MFGNVYGLDLGTYEIKVYDKKQDSLWKEKNAVAIANDHTIVSVGDDAYAMYEKAPLNIEIVFPMKEGVISHFYNMQYLLQNLIRKDQHFVRGSKYVIAVPTDVTEVEKRAFYDLVVHSTARAKEVRIVERGIADAIGLDLDVHHSPGIFIVNLGAETTELSILAYGGVVLNKMLKFGSRTLDHAIINSVRYNQDFLIGQLTAEILRKSFDLDSVSVAGRNLLTRIPEEKIISMSFIHAAIKDLLKSLAYEIHALLERTPPEVQKSIQRDCIYLTGGLANLKKIDYFLENSLGIKVHVAEQPEFCATSGLKRMINSKELMKSTYSMLDENYRWMR